MRPSGKPLTTEPIVALAEEAYIFAFPMLENYRTMDRTTGSGAPYGKRRCFNTLYHAENLLGPDFKGIVAPNNDTLYSSSWLDLDSGPLVLSVPDIPRQRYFVFQMVNMYNHNFGYIGTRTTGSDAADYLIAGYRWKGPVPAGIRKVFRSESRFAFLLGRTLVAGPDDLDRVRTIQRGYRLRTLDEYLGREGGASKAERSLPPYEPEKAQTAAFIGLLNFILGQAAIHPDDQPLLDRLAAIGLNPGSPFDHHRLSPEMNAAIETGIRQANQKIAEKVKAINRRVNGWSSLVGSHGPRAVLSRRYLINAAGAKAGLYGNDKEEASNFVAFVDETGADLDGSKHTYRLHFDAGRLPPVNGFWSITLYRLPEILLVHNPIDRYAIGDRTPGVQYGRDGSLDIYLQHPAPAPEQASNWLPCPEGPFAVALRCYLPDETAFKTYFPPGIQPMT
jgi:hypothetical protein